MNQTDHLAEQNISLDLYGNDRSTARIREICMAKNKRDLYGKNKRDLYGKNKRDLYGKNKRDLYGKNKRDL